MSTVLVIEVGKGFYLRNPQDTPLGQKIVSESVKLLDQLGFDAFTFKKLAAKIKSTEASVYRYFESKHQLLQYLTAWYWNWVEYVIRYKTANVKDPLKRLGIALEVLVSSDVDDPSTTHIDESLLHKIVAAESARVYLTRQSSKKERVISKGYEEIEKVFLEIFKELNKKYEYPSELVGTIIAMVHNQLLHTGASTKKSASAEKIRVRLKAYMEHLVLSALTGVK